MAVTGWLIDKSALWKLNRSPDKDEWQNRIGRGLLHTCLVTELEVAVSARNAADLDVLRRALLAPMVPAAMTPSAESTARDIVAVLTSSQLHRAVPLPDVIIAAIAVAEGLTVLHDDRDFERIAEVYGAPAVERLRL